MAVALANPSDDGGRTKVRKGGVQALALKEAGSHKRELPQTDTGSFSMLGVSWKGAKAQIKGTAQVRTRSSETGEWSGWQKLEAGDAQPDEVGAGVRGASEPLWVGPSNAVEARVVADDGTASSGLPAGLRLDLVDPGVTAEEAKAADAD
ncbi:MAG: hypothetical protein QOF44_137, partial [Streptomyces sp.]|nr:hypothetical protein [Streptomyces sp.]